VVILGAMLMQRNFVAAGHSIGFHGCEIRGDDVMISYLPLAHCFERVLQVAMYNGIHLL
jgi:long-subunit acyl-CoA synthetase (AMP-forming)